jgi:hypothetical protein
MGNEAAGQQVSESASQRGVAGLDPCGGADGTCGAADARGRLARAYTPSPPSPLGCLEEVACFQCAGGRVLP